MSIPGMSDAVIAIGAFVAFVAFFTVGSLWAIVLVFFGMPTAAFAALVAGFVAGLIALSRAA